MNFKQEKNKMKINQKIIMFKMIQKLKLQIMIKDKKNKFNKNKMIINQIIIENQQKINV